MMKVGLYQDLRGSIGGGEYCLAVLARALLSNGFQVDLVHHQGSNFAERLSSFFEIDLQGVGERPLPKARHWSMSDIFLLRRGRAMRDWLREASEAYDVFVCITHTPPPFNRARRGVLYVLFPLEDLTEPWAKPSLKEFIRSTLYRKWCKERMDSYDAIASISEFTRHWTRRYWCQDSLVIHPPVDLGRFAPGVKEDRILVLGRFAPSKRQLELVSTFKQYRSQLAGWEMACIGGYTESDPTAKHYFESVQALGHGMVELVPNCPTQRISFELGRSKIFWHAMGIGVDETREPLKIEHFGIATVEAMAAGCVPIVVNGGGQREIVTHGENGFVCDTFEEFAERTIELSRDPKRTQQMSLAAQNRAKDFASRVFEAKMLDLIRPHFLDNPRNGKT